MKRQVFTLFGSFVVAAIALAAPITAHAQAKPKATRACGLSVLPLSLGNQWTYEGVGAPAERALSEAAARNSPRQAKKIVVTVTAVETQGDVTQVTLSEDVDGRVLSTTIRCGATKLEIDPSSFFFAGEPGGAWNVNLTGVEQKGNTWQLQGGRLIGPEWRNDVVASWERVASKDSGANLGKGKLEMERRFVLGNETDVALKDAVIRAREVNIEITGRITLDPPAEKPFEMPANFRSTLWFATGTGIVQVINGFAHMYILTAQTIN